MSKERCIEIEINGSRFPFHFGMGAIIKFSKMKKWDGDPAIEIVSRLLTLSGSQADQAEFHKIAAAAGAALQGEGVKPPKDSDIEDSFFTIVNITQNEVYPKLMADMGIDVKPMIDKIKKSFNQEPEPGKE